MKFGQSLDQRSVPQWRSYNIDYAQIKRFIKDNTTPGNGNAVAIPGRGTELSQRFEDELFSIFESECARVSLFVRSKRYEMESRLGSIERQLDMVSKKNPLVANPQKALRLRQRYSKIESDILSVGEEIQKLSRFNSINKTAVRKLLKKHRKWSGSQSLAPKVDVEILAKDDSFARMHLQPCLERYGQFLERVRSPFTLRSKNGDAGYGRGEASLSSQQDGAVDEHISLASELRPSKRHFDEAFASSGADSGTECIVYWVHNDNITELKVLILQHMRSLKQGSSATSPTAAASRRGSDHSSVTARRGQDKMITLYVDNECRFEHVDEVSSGTLAPHRTLLWYERQEDEDMTELQKTISRTLEAANTDPRDETRKNPRDSGISWHDSDPEEVFEDTWSQMQASEHGKPIAQANFARSRYTSLGQADSPAYWATLDEDVQYSNLLPGKLATTRCSTYVERLPKANLQSFPHAVLTVRNFGQSTIALLPILDRSHLVERVPGFELADHVLASLFRPSHAGLPPWLDRLARDIRRIPNNTADVGRGQRSSTENGSSTSSTLQGTPQTASPATASPTSAGVTFLPDMKRTIPKQKQESKELQKRYWSEYDFPESEAGDEFALYVDPDAPIFPGQAALIRWYGNVKKVFKRRSQYNKSLRRSTSRSPSVRSASTTSSDEEADDELSGFYRAAQRKPLLRDRARDYGAISQRGLSGPYERRSDSLGFLTTPYTSTLCLLAAVLILLISTFLTVSSRRKLRGEVDIAVVLGVLASFCFTGVAMISWWFVEIPRRGDLIDNFGLEAQRSKSAREWMRTAVRRLGDILRVIAMTGIAVGGALLMVVALR